MSKERIADWDPEDPAFWETAGRRIARRNLVFSIFVEFLGFAVWVLWSVTAAQLNEAGFDLSTSQLFTLVAVPAVVGATLRLPYTLAVGRFGGRTWTVVSAVLLLVPVALLVAVVSEPATPYWILLSCAATAGLGGGNFASSMANISYFYPSRTKGFALALNAAGGNLGVAATQLVVPLVAASPALIGASQNGTSLQNAGLMWIPLIVAAAGCAWLFMDDLKVARARFRDQAVVVTRKQTWVMAWLYVGTFGSFIGYSVGLPLLIQTQFPGTSLSIAFLGPLVGSLARPLGGLLADRLGGARVTFSTFAAMIACVGGVIFFVGHRTESYAFTGFLSMFVVLLMLSGIGNGSTYRMIPMIYRAIHLETVGGPSAPAAPTALAAAAAETAAALGLIGAVGAFGGWLIPQAYGLSTSMTGGPTGAFLAFIAFYASCLALTWWYYMRRSFATARAPSLARASI